MRRADRAVHLIIQRVWCVSRKCSPTLCLAPGPRQTRCHHPVRWQGAAKEQVWPPLSSLRFASILRSPLWKQMPWAVERMLTAWCLTPPCEKQDPWTRWAWCSTTSRRAESRWRARSSRSRTTTSGGRSSDAARTPSSTKKCTLCARCTALWRWEFTGRAPRPNGSGQNSVCWTCQMFLLKYLIIINLFLFKWKKKDL